jgi:hypothetical protein
MDEVVGAGGLMQTIIQRLALATAGIVFAAIAHAQEKDPRPAAGIQDNSFLIEEAYNQEEGVVQHIGTLRRQHGDWFYTFTQEWPLGGETHQFSYTLPYSWIRNDFGQRVHGPGDVFLNYRYQVMMESATLPAFAPRLSLILPTGNKDKGTGDGSTGIEINLPFSKIVSDRVTLHADATMQHLFDVDGFHPTSYSVGGSAIYAVTRDFNLMLESLVEWDESVSAMRTLERETTYTISPGFRYALNLPELADLQIVLGAATPISFTRSARTDYGAFLYLSFEHNFIKKNQN